MSGPAWSSRKGGASPARPHARRSARAPNAVVIGIHLAGGAGFPASGADSGTGIVILAG